MTQGFEIERRAREAQAAVSFGEVAWALGLKGSSRAGWNCPRCGGQNTLQEDTAKGAAACTGHGCGAKPGKLFLVMAVRGVSFLDAIAWLETYTAHAKRPAFQPAPDAGRIFPPLMKGDGPHGQG
jgi:phage/plasmid primase-like uncharacterized protein